MKTLKIAISVALVSLFMMTLNTPVLASEKNKSSNNLEKVQKLIDRAIDFPQEAKESGISGTVKAQLQINSEGKITVEEINGNPQLTKYVEQQLNNLSVNDFTLTGTTFIAKFDFRN